MSRSIYECLLAILHMRVVQDACCRYQAAAWQSQAKLLSGFSYAPRWFPGRTGLALQLACSELHKWLISWLCALLLKLAVTHGLPG